jgi:cell division transport system permease protein
VALRVSYVALEAVRGFRRNLLLTTSMVIITAISLTQLGLALLAGRQLDLYTQFWSNKVEVSIFLDDTVTPQQRAAIHRKLVAIPAVASVHYQSKNDAYQEFRRLFRDSPDAVRVARPEYLPQSFRVKLTDPARFGEVHDRFCRS